MSDFFLKEIAEIWRENKMTVNILNGPVADAPADLLIMHVDLTVIPDEYLEIVEKYPVVINGAVKDISKRAFSANIVSLGSDYRGPVVLKSDRNHGGATEARVAEIAAKGTAIAEHERPFMYYSVFNSVDNLPAGVWTNPRLVVERFLPERRDGLFCLRTWVFLGDKETNSICYSKEPIVKSSTVIRREKVADVPDELRVMRKNLKFDFGKFDYAIVDGRVVLYDINRTPTLGNFNKQQFLPNLRLLAEGIRVYL